MKAIESLAAAVATARKVVVLFNAFLIRAPRLKTILPSPLSPSLRGDCWLPFLAWARLVRLVMTDCAACRRANGAVSGHVSSDAADDRAFDASLCFGLKRRDCGDDDERRENSDLSFHLITLDVVERRRPFSVSRRVGVDGRALTGPFGWRQAPVAGASVGRLAGAGKKHRAKRQAPPDLSRGVFRSRS